MHHGHASWSCLQDMYIIERFWAFHMETYVQLRQWRPKWAKQVGRRVCMCVSSSQYVVQ